MAFYVSRDVHVLRVEGKEFTETPCDFRPTDNDKVYVVTHSPFRKPTQEMWDLTLQLWEDQMYFAQIVADDFEVWDDELGWISYKAFKERGYVLNLPFGTYTYLRDSYDYLICDWREIKGECIVNCGYMKKGGSIHIRTKENEEQMEC